MQASGSATPGASAGTRCRLYSPATLRRASGHALSRAASLLPHDDEMGDYLEAYAARFELPVRSGTTVEALTKDGDRFVVTAGDQTFEADNVVVATGVMQKPLVPELRGRARPAHHAAALERLPEPLAAPGGPRARRRREPLGRRHRLRGGRRARDDPVGTGHGQIPASVETRRGRIAFRGLFFARHARPHRRHADRPEDAPAHPARRRTAPALPQEGSARRRGRARARADGRCRRTGCPCSTAAASSTSRT